MTLQHDTLLNWSLPDVTHRYDERDTAIYAIGVGVSVEPLLPENYRYVYEGAGLVTLPTMPTVIGQRAAWMDDQRLGIDCSRIVHGEQQIVIAKPLPVAAEIVSGERVTGVFDKGSEKGAVVWTERTIADAADGELYTTLRTSYFLRGDGGFGGQDAPGAISGPSMPDREPDHRVDLRTRPDQAILYRLSGDVNPLHVDRAFAQKAGFPEPILHGLCIYGIAGRALVASACGGDPARLVEMAVRFSSPCYPGETIRTEMWAEGGKLAFRSLAVERGVVVLNNGLATVAA